MGRKPEAYYNQTSIETFLQAVEGSAGIFSIIAKRLGVTYYAVIQRYYKHQVIRDAVDRERAKMIDNAEAVLMNQLNSEDEKIAQRAAMFILERYGKRLPAAVANQPIQEEQPVIDVTPEVVTVEAKPGVDIESALMSLGKDRVLMLKNIAAELQAKRTGTQQSA